MFVFKIFSYFGPEEFNVREKNKVKFFHLLFCTLEEPNLPLQIFQIALMFDGKKTQIHFHYVKLKLFLQFFNGYRQKCNL